MEGSGGMSPSVRRWFLPEVPDVLGMLGHQADVTLEGMAAFTAWASGQLHQEAAVRSAEHDADQARRVLIESVRDAFTTPLPSEDLFEISAHLDEIINGAKNTVREAALMGVLPDVAIKEMAELLEEGVRHLDDAFGTLGSDGLAATTCADAAIKTQRRLERVYRRAMSELLEIRDLREVLARQELYRRINRISDSVVSVAERVWYCIVKES
jgi:uncharacterized protein Yka (UPF0111/DUF47 family)